MEETAEERGKYRCTADEMAIILEATGLGPSAPFSPAGAAPNLEKQETTLNVAPLRCHT
jgi:hypothetical protein